MACWMSYNSNYSLERQYLFGHECMISVTLDAGAHEFFSGIRLLVVCGEGNLLETVTLKDRFEPTGTLAPSYRQFLSRCTDGAKLSEHLSCALHDTPSQPLCTVVFEITGLNGVSTIGLTPRPELVFWKPQRIVYERVYPCISIQHSAVALLDSSHSFGQRGPMTALREPPIPTMVGHNIRVIPIYIPRPPFRPLPRRVLRHIVRYAFEHKNKGWRRDFLAIGLVCKGWSHVLNLFFQSLSTGYNNDPPDAIAVIRSLEIRPDRARLIQHFASGAFKVSAGVERARERSQAFVTILQQAKSLKEVRLRDIHASNVPAAIDALSQLCEMKKLYVDGTPNLSSRHKKFRKFTMPDLQRAISNSKNLRKFAVSFWRECDDTHVQFPPLAKLESLELGLGRISGPQFLHFAMPRLRKLHLSHVTGLVNGDLLGFLSQVAPTLQRLVIEHTVIPRGVAEEYALDAVMPFMANLVCLFARGDLASALTLTRKPVTPLGKSSSLYLPGMNVFGMDILMAIEVTRWDSVHICPDYPSRDAWDEASREKASEIARKRGVHLTLGRVDSD